MEARGAINQYMPYAAGRVRPNPRGRGVYLDRATPPSGSPEFTINLADGVTPFIKNFRGKEYSSCCYRLSAVACTVAWGWYRPRADYFSNLDEWTQDHVLNGGLCLAELSAAIGFQLPDDPVRTDWSYEQFQEWCLSYYGKRRPPMERPPQPEETS